MRALSPQVQKMLDRQTRRPRSAPPSSPERDARIAALLATTPVRPPEFPPLDTTDAPVIKVGSETIGVDIPEEAWETHGLNARFMEGHGNRENDKAAMRHHLDQPFEWGRGADGRSEMRIAVLLNFKGKLLTVVLEGTEGAIRRALPDKTTLAAWRSVGATDFPLWNFDPAAGQLGRVTWVPIADVPNLVQVLQMEYASRWVERDSRHRD